MRELTIQSKSGATINLRCEQNPYSEDLRYIAEIPQKNLKLQRDRFPWGWNTEQGQKILVLGHSGSQRQATTVSESEESRINEFIGECKEWQQTEKQKLYQPLIAQLPAREFSTTGNDEKAQELLQQASEIKDVKGPEMDGVNLAQSQKRQALRREAKEHCDHDLDENYQHTYTGDARRKIVREITCEKCGMGVRDEASEELSEEAIWR